MGMQTQQRHNGWRMHPAGFTLIEVLMAVVLLISGVVVILMAMNVAMIHSEYLTQMQVARHAAQGLLERLTAVPTQADFDALSARPKMPQMTVCQLEDLNCNGQGGALPPGEVGELDLNSNGVIDDGGLLATGAVLLLQIRNDQTMLNVHVTACWQHRGHSISEDLTCDGTLTPAEDLNGNGWVDSPVMVSAKVGRKS